MDEQRDHREPLVAVCGSTCMAGERLTGRQRSIVAALAFHGEAGATTDVLVDVVWAGEAPKAARQSLQNQITRLRRRFGPDVIQTDLDGYRLRAATDVARFEALVVPWLDRPVDPAAVEPLTAALAGWRGTPYADLLDYVPAEAERSRLEELHAAAQEHLAASWLAAGDHRRAVAELAALVTEDPYRERRWTLLVLANHLAGRHADALATYDRAVARFADDLRACPSTVLTLLRDRIAAGETIALRDLEDVAPPTAADPTDPSAADAAAAPHRRARSARCAHRRFSSAR